MGDIRPIVLAVFDKFDYSLGFLDIVHKLHVQVLSAVIAHFLALCGVKVLAQERHLHEAPAHVRFLAVLQDRVERVHVLILPRLRVVIVRHYEEIVTLSVTI